MYEGELAFEREILISSACVIVAQASAERRRRRQASEVQKEWNVCLRPIWLTSGVSALISVLPVMSSSSSALVSVRLMELLHCSCYCTGEPERTFLHPQSLIKVKGPLSFHQSHFITPPLLTDVHIVLLMPSIFNLSTTWKRANTQCSRSDHGQLPSVFVLGEADNYHCTSRSAVSIRVEELARCEG